MTVMTTVHRSTVSFSGHETFPFRLGWLGKGVRAVDKNADIFAADDAILTLGVGKNMVHSIRHWCLAFKLIDETKRGHYTPTAWGRKLFIDTDGVDPYLEKPGTLWWLHWTLANNQDRATTWYYTFNRLSRNEFNKMSLRELILEFVARAEARAPSKASLDRDIDCMTRTYWTPRRQWSEESFECPLVELNLIQGTADRYQLIRGTQTSLPNAIFGAALVESYQRSPWKNSATIPVEYILYNEGAPGRVFLLDESTLIGHLSRLAFITQGAMSYDATAGLRQVLVHHRNIRAEDLLEAYYRRS